MEADPLKKVLEFWFCAEGSEGYGQGRSFWFEASPSMDLGAPRGGVSTKGESPCG